MNRNACRQRLVVALLVATCAWIAAPRPAASQAIDCPAPPHASAPLDVVRYLADDRLEGRLAGSAGERCAGDYIAARFRALGLEPGGERGSYFQELPIASALNPHAAAGTGRNVVGILRGRRAAAGEHRVVVGAHYDHLGLGGPGSAAPDAAGQVHNGADDNASGVAAMLRAAELLAVARPTSSVVFVAFTGEESGLLGSAYFVEQPAFPPGHIRAMLNLDMVGRLGTDALIIYGVATATEWPALLESVSSKHAVPLALQDDGYGPSDHTSFYARDIPVLHFFTNTHADYHRPSDDWERIDAAGLEKVAAIVADVARAVADDRFTLTLRRDAGARPVATSGGYGAYLGSVPDFSPVERGVLLGGVTPGSPADRAGIVKGDVIVGLGEYDVADLQGLTDALRAYRPGERVEVRLLRAGEIHAMHVELGSRSARR